MSTQPETRTIVPIRPAQTDVSHDPFPLDKVQPGAYDKLGNKIIEVVWLSPDYAVYRTRQGVFIHFSDNREKEKEQRIAFTTICPELCELRYLTNEMAANHRIPGRFFRVLLFGRQPEGLRHSMFDHNIAQSLMLLMEGKLDDAKAIATAALDMAVTRSTNDNTIRYLTAAMSSTIIFSILLLGCHRAFPFIIPGAGNPGLFFVAAAYGVLGASFSIFTRVQSFQMKPSEQSKMNYWMAPLRIMIGLIGGLAFYLLAQSSLGQSFISEKLVEGWQGAALIGFLGGFAERLVQTVFQGTAAGIEGKAGTPVQVMRTTTTPATPPSPPVAANTQSPVPSFG
jgi:hypothetical protein